MSSSVGKLVLPFRLSNIAPPEENLVNPKQDYRLQDWTHQSLVSLPSLHLGYRDINFASGNQGFR